MKTLLVFVGIAAIGTLLGGCAGANWLETDLGMGPSRLELDYGTSFQLMKFNQTLDPEAEKNLKPVIGLDGEASKAVLGTYRKGFEDTGTPPSDTSAVMESSKWGSSLTPLDPGKK